MLNYVKIFWCEYNFFRIKKTPAKAGVQTKVVHIKPLYPTGEFYKKCPNKPSILCGLFD